MSERVPRIAHLCSPVAEASAWVIVRYRALELLRRGIPVRLFITDPGPIPSASDPLSSVTDVCGDPEQLAKAVGRFSPDWIVALGSRSSASNTRVARTHTASSRVLIECQVSDPANLSPIVEPDHLAGVAAIMVPSPSTRDFLHDVLPRRVPIGIVPNVVDHTFFGASAVRPSGPPIVLWVGRFEPVKNWPAMLEIAEHVLRQTEARFLVVGGAYSEPDLQSRFQEELRRRDIADAVAWRPTVAHSSMPSVYADVAASGGCLLSTSYSECQPISVLEAMAAGCPVVASAVRGVMDEVRHQETGWLYPVDAPAAAAHVVVDVLGGGVQRDRVVERATRHASRYTASEAVDRFLDLVRNPPATEAYEPAGVRDPTSVDGMLRATRLQMLRVARQAHDAQGQIEWLHREVAHRDQTVAWLHREVAARDETVAWLHREVAARDQTVAWLHAEVAARDATIAELAKQRPSSASPDG
jgi:glycosyltransferase involved in cell wall biosynthesis